MTQFRLLSYPGNSEPIGKSFVSSSARYCTGDRIVGVSSRTGEILIWDSNTEELIEAVLSETVEERRIDMRSQGLELIGNVVIDGLYNDYGVSGVAFSHAGIWGRGCKAIDEGPFYVNLRIGTGEGGIGVLDGSEGCVTIRRPNTPLFDPESNKVFGRTESLEIGVDDEFYSSLVHLERFGYGDQQITDYLNFSIVDTCSGRALKMYSHGPFCEIDSAALSPSAPYWIAVTQFGEFATFLATESDGSRRCQEFYDVGVPGSDHCMHMAFSNDSSLLAISTTNGLIDIRDVETRESVCVLNVPSEYYGIWFEPCAIVFSPEKSQLLVVNGPHFLVADF